MLKRIFIQNFALIDVLEINLHQGLEVVTGETGAGKSIILGALRLILGERADLKSIQNAEKKSIVEAEFFVSGKLKPFFEENDLDYETETLIRREILPSGKSRAFVNDVPVTLDVLKQLSEHLIDIHSQFETSELFNEAFQFRLIDALGENKKRLPEYQNEFEAWKNLQSELKILKKELTEGNRDADYKKFLLTELEEADLDELNLKDLETKLSLQENAESISENLSEIFRRTDQEAVGLLDAFRDVRGKLGKVASLSHQFTEPYERFESLFVEFKDILFELQDKAEKIEIDPKLLVELQEKINKINALYLKHHVNSVSELIELRDQLAQQQSDFAGLEEKISATEKQISDKEKNLQKLSEKLTQNRKEEGLKFTQKLESLLKKLGLEKAKVAVELTPDVHFNPFGKDKIQFLFQANSGFSLKPIQSAISGGERSRVMFAVKKIMAENAELPTLILDEIDTGVSGKIAAEMGEMMHEMAKNRQLIVITHLAQVAAKGDHHYKVVKKDMNGKAQSDIIALTEEEKVKEVAQLLSGSKITEAAIRQAEELMK